MRAVETTSREQKSGNIDAWISQDFQNFNPTLEKEFYHEEETCVYHTKLRATV